MMCTIGIRYTNTFLLCKYAIDVLCITESMLDDSVIDSELSIAGYHLLRNDRTRMGGGCAIYFHSSLDVTFIDSLHCNDIEILWCDIKPSSGKSFLLGCLYRPPSSNVSYYSHRYPVTILFLSCLFVCLSVCLFVCPEFFSALVLVAAFALSIFNSIWFLLGAY